MPEILAEPFSGTVAQWVVPVFARELKGLRGSMLGVSTRVRVLSFRGMRFELSSIFVVGEIDQLACWIDGIVVTKST